jgi:hypothetical protein
MTETDLTTQDLRNRHPFQIFVLRQWRPLSTYVYVHRSACLDKFKLNVLSKALNILVAPVLP